jgi:NADP-dependent 3-hydroxy acid dehydrogenase YdfG
LPLNFPDFRSNKLPSQMTLANKLILITGGSSGIGKATAIQLAQQGAEIIIQARSIDKLKSAAAEIEAAGGKVHIYSTDLTDGKAVEQAATKIVEEVGLPDIVINSAGAGDWLSMKEATIQHYEETMASPYLATAFTCKAFYDLMQSRGSGHFIIVNSAACFFSFPKATGYGPARWAMMGLARALQADLHGTKFKVSMIALGKVNSPYFTNNPVSEDRIPRIAEILVPSMTEAASGKAIARLVKRPRNLVVRPFLMGVFAMSNRLVPGVFRWLMRVG